MMKYNVQNKPAGRITIIVLAILSALGLIIFWLSENALWICDLKAYQYHPETGEKIKTLGQVFLAQYADYFCTNGRFIAHIISRFYLSIVGQTLFSISNALVYVAYVVVIMRYAGLSIYNWRQVLITALMVLFFCDTDYGPNFQISYVWMFLLVLIFILAFFNDSCRKVKNPLLLMLIFILSIIIGNGHESLNIGVGGALCIYVLIHKGRVTVSQWLMLIGFGIGGVILSLSPAVMGRVSTSQQMPIVYSVLQVLISFRAFYLLVFTICVRMVLRRFDFKDWYKRNSFDVNALVILIAFNIFIGISTHRQLFGIELMSAVIVLRMLGDTKLRALWLGIATAVVVTIIVAKSVEENKAKDAYSDLVNEIRDRSGDVVYVDFPQFNGLIAPVTPLRQGVYLDYVMWSAFVDIYGDTKHYNDDVRVYPSALRDVLELTTPVDTVIEYLPGEYVVATAADGGATAVLCRSVGAFGLGCILPDADIDVSQGCTTLDGRYRILFLPNISPLIKNRGVKIKND